MADALFVEALRHYMEQLPAEANSWLAGARDPVVMHRQPCPAAPDYPVENVQVAGEVRYESEAAFNRAFKRELGFPPAQYRKEFVGNIDSSAASGL